MSVTDIAYCILKTGGKAVHFKELITEVIRVKAISQEASGRLMAQMHTEINLDSRFIHQGGGEWGLREWTNKGSKVVRIRPETPTAPTRTRPNLRVDEEEDDVHRIDEDEDEYKGKEEPDDEYESEDEDDAFEDEEDE